MSTNRDSGFTEALVTIDGAVLSDAEVCTLRVAVSSFMMKLQDPKQAAQLGSIAAGYLAHGSKVEEMLVDGGSRPDRLQRSMQAP